MAASSLWTVAQAYPSPADGVEAPSLVQVDEALDDASALEPGQVAAITPDQSWLEALAEEPLVSPDPSLESELIAPPALAIAPVTPEVLEQLSQEQLAAIASIISTAEASASANLVAELPPEVLTQLDVLPIIERQVGRRRWMPTGLVRRLRVPQLVAALIRQPKNTALVMLGNHIVVVNPVTGAVLGAVLSVL
ncbi:MAG: hypothetical protein EA342_14640 [Leptolyngbya sp. LCM1.Bin17]|nr:MAG: hypothetical protein EA342_14640 [Leptolyngbya sp. LCM1.Bin17]